MSDYSLPEHEPNRDSWGAELWGRAAAAERERIRLELLAEAERERNRDGYRDCRIAAQQALLKFARRLEPVTASAYVDGQRISATAGTPEEADAELTRLAGLEPKP